MPEKEPIDSRVFERSYIEGVKSLTPEHPVTKENGVFSRFAGEYPNIRPIYETPSGKEFKLLDLEDEDRFVQASDELIILDETDFSALE
jgi:hypothetical protein